MARRAERAADPARQPVARRSVFVAHAPHAHSVCLAGTFNGWDPASLPMTRRVTGDWTIELELAPGRHEYKYVIDGRWCCAADADACASPAPASVQNAFGTLNHVRDV